jgi:flagellar assembly factor FliW
MVISVTARGGLHVAPENAYPAWSATMSEIESIQTERFGEIRVPKAEILHFPEGLLGFADCKDFVLVQEAAYAPFIWLQSAQDPHLAFVVVDPLEFVPDYRVEIKPSEVSSLDLADIEKAKILVIVVVREDPDQITANLQGPLVINVERCLGKQVVLLTERYHTRHFILQEAEERTPNSQNSAGS